MRDEEGYVRAIRGWGGCEILWSVLLGGFAAAWLHGSQLTWGSELVEPAPLPVREEPEPKPVPLPVAPAFETPAFESHRLRRRGWLLRRALLVADLVALACAVVALDVLGASVALGNP